MGVREQVSRSHVGQSHFVQFFDSNESRHDAVAGFLSEGHRRGAPLVVIARPSNLAPILERLEGSVGALQAHIADGRVIALDAIATLTRISRNGSPDASHFEDRLASVFTHTSRHGRIYAFGEMVDILAERGEFHDAIRLERLWNGLFARIDLTFLCGYAAAHFVSHGAQEALRQVCTAHATIRVESQDPLAAWLLQQAQ